MSSLAHQVVVVTGASSGIGEAIARGLAAHGARVALVARRTEMLTAIAAEINSANGTAIAINCDVTDPASCNSMVKEVIDSFGQIDTVFANHGVAEPARFFTKINVDDFRQVLEVNVTGVLNIAQACHGELAKNGGRLIVTGSGSGRNSLPKTGGYAVSKAAVAHLVRLLAVEWRRDNICVNELIPGPVKTAMMGADASGNVAQGTADFIEATGEWFKSPVDVVPLARLLAEFPVNGPSGQAFALNGRILG